MTNNDQWSAALRGSGGVAGVPVRGIPCRQASMTQTVSRAMARPSFSSASQPGDPSVHAGEATAFAGSVKLFVRADRGLILADRR